MEGEKRGGGGPKRTLHWVSWERRTSNKSSFLENQPRTGGGKKGGWTVY